MGLVFFLFMLALWVVIIIAYCKMFSKAGWHWAMGLLMLVPVVNVIMFFYYAFATWPRDRVTATAAAPQAPPGQV